jgi:hypothetical protein
VCGLPCQLTRPSHASPALELVGAVRRQAPMRLPRAEPPKWLFKKRSRSSTASVGSGAAAGVDACLIVSVATPASPPPPPPPSAARRARHQATVLDHPARPTSDELTQHPRAQGARCSGATRRRFAKRHAAGMRSGRPSAYLRATSAETPIARGSVAGVTDYASSAGTDRVVERRRAVSLARHYREFEGLSIRQIADRLGRSPATIKAYFYDPSHASKRPT